MYTSSIVIIVLCICFVLLKLHTKKNMQGGELDGLGNGRHKYKLLVNCDAMMGHRLMLRKWTNVLCSTWSRERTE